VSILFRGNKPKKIALWLIFSLPYMQKPIRNQSVGEEAFGLLSDGGVAAFGGVLQRSFVVPIYMGA
jgi:hypothetical protein